MTVREFFAYTIQERRGVNSLVHLGRKLYQQFLVDGYTMIESERPSFIRFQQKKLRLDTYRSLSNHVADGNTDATNAGQRIILPSSFTGGSRYMTYL